MQRAKPLRIENRPFTLSRPAAEPTVAAFITVSPVQRAKTTENRKSAIYPVSTGNRTHGSCFHHCVTRAAC